MKKIIKHIGRGLGKLALESAIGVGKTALVLGAILVGPALIPDSCSKYLPQPVERQNRTITNVDFDIGSDDSYEAVRRISPDGSVISYSTIDPPRTRMEILRRRHFGVNEDVVFQQIP